MGVSKMSMLRWIEGHTSRYMIRNECNCRKLEVALVEEKMGDEFIEMVWACST